MGVKEYLKEKFSESGIQPRDIAKCTGYFMCISFAWIGVLWSFTYAVRPTNAIIAKLPYPKVKTLFQKATEKAENNKMLKKLPPARRANLTISFAEMVFIKSLVGPFMFPLKVWMAVLITRATSPVRNMASMQEQSQGMGEEKVVEVE